MKLSRMPLGGRLPALLPLPPITRACPHADYDAGSRVFSAEEADALIAAAAGMSRRSELLLMLLFTTGLRIGAAARMTWDQVLLPATSREQCKGSPLLMSDVRCTTSVREKGNTVRHILLTDALRSVLATAYNEAADPARED